MIDPSIVDTVVEHFLKNAPKYDYVSNTVTRSFPRGLDVEIFSMEAFEKMATVAKQTEYREHVTLYFYEHPEEFSIGSVVRGARILRIAGQWTLRKILR